MSVDPVRRARQALPCAELPARMVHPLLPFPRPAPRRSRSNRRAFTPSHRPDPTGFRVTCATAWRRPWRHSATGRRRSPWRRFSAGSGPRPAGFSPRSRLTGASWPSMPPLGSRRRGCAARSGRWKRSGFSTVPSLRARRTSPPRTGCTASRYYSCSGATMARCSARPTGGLRRPVSGIRARGAHQHRPSYCGRPRAFSMARPLNSPKNKDSEASRVIMGEIRPSPIPTNPNPNLEAALERWKKAAEGQGLLRSDQRDSQCSRQKDPSHG